MRRLCFLLSLFAASAAGATDYVALPGSTLGFTATYQGEAFAGSFAKFVPQIRFDPGKLAESRFDVRITLASADTRNSERDDMLKGSEFFDTANKPEGRYVATRFRALGGNRYVADGVLTLHGVSKPAPLAFSWTPGTKPTLDGTAMLKRLDFNVGTGDWTDLDLIPNEVKVRTHLLLAPVLAKPAK
jgi:polyisoprenoid-binding protein YceI